MAVLETLSRYRWVILFISLLVQFSGALIGQMLGPLAPLFQAELGLSKGEVGLFTSACYAGALSVMLIAGSLTDRFSVRRVMSSGLLVAGALLLLMPLTTGMYDAMAVLFLTAVARGLVFPGSTRAILDWFPAAARATAMGLKQTGAPLGGIITAVALPTLGLAIGWRSAIFLVGLVVIVAGVITASLYRNQRSAASPARSAVSMREGMANVLRNRLLWTVSLIAFLNVMAQQSLIIYLALYLKEILLVEAVPDERARIVAAGGYLAVAQMGGVFGRIFWGIISDRVFHGRQRFAVMSIVGIITTTVGLTIRQTSPGVPLWFLAILVFVAGVSAIGWNGIYHTLMTETAGRKYAATGVGLSMTVVETGAMVGPPVFGFTVDITGTYGTAWLLLSASAAAGTLVAALAARSEMRRGKSSE